MDHPFQGRNLGAANCPVAQHPGQRRNSVHELPDIGTESGTFVQCGHHRRQRARELGEQALLHQPGHFGDVRGVASRLDRLSRGRRFDSRPVQARLDGSDGQLRLPVQRPFLTERPGASLQRSDLPPGDTENIQPVEQLTAAQVGVFPKVELERTGTAFGPQAQPALLCDEVGSEGDRRRPRWDLADGVADDKATPYQVEDGVVAAPEHRARGVGALGQSCEGTAAHRSQGLSQPYRLDDRGRRSFELFCS